MSMRYAIVAAAAFITSIMAAHAQSIDAAAVSVSPNGFRPMWLSPSTSARAPRQLNEIPTNDAFASIGRGFDPVTNTILDIQCVKPASGSGDPLNGTLPFVNQEIVSDVQSHARVSGSSISAGAIVKAVSLGFGSSNSQGDYFNQADTFFRLYVSAPTEGREWRDVVWTDDALTLIRTDMTEFLRQCGTRYVRAVFSGHLLDATVRFALHADKRTNADANAVSLGVEKIFGLSAGDSSAESEISTKASMRLWSQGRGVLALPPAVAPPSAANGTSTGAAAPAPVTPTPGQPAPTPPTPPSPPGSDAQIAQGGVSQLIAWYNTGFIAAVEKAKAEKKDALPLYIRVDDYRSKFRLQRRFAIPLLSEYIASAVAETSDDYASMVTTLSTADYATAKSPSNSDFFVEPQMILEQTVKDAKRIFADYKSAAALCQSIAAQGVGKFKSEADAVEACRTALHNALKDMCKLKITRKPFTAVPPSTPEPPTNGTCQNTVADAARR